jgi:hypothetical protein
MRAETIVARCPYFLVSDVFRAVCIILPSSSFFHLLLSFYGIDCFWLCAELFTKIFHSFCGLIFCVALAVIFVGYYCSFPCSLSSGAGLLFYLDGVVVVSWQWVEYKYK